MKKRMIQTALLSVAASLLIACGGTAKPIPSEPDKPDPSSNNPIIGSTACQDPRPEMCIQQYLPVCGYWTEAPPCKPGMVCPAIALIKKKTYSNSCAACSDPKVNGYKKGECSS